MTSQNKKELKESNELSSFIEGVCETDPFKVERDLGHGYVKLRSSEAEKRQAAQDIRCVEDIVIELLRNSRDAGAHNIFVATSKEAGVRSLLIIDDGAGIPHEMWDAIFEPRVTSKLETAHMDKWGMHGRGMALYSTRVNTLSSAVVASEVDLGTALLVRSDACLSEKADQSSLPTFEMKDGISMMRGPKNILRTCCEFALEHRGELNIYVGSPAQIAAALYSYGLSTIPAYQRAFSNTDGVAIIKRLGLSSSPEDLSTKAQEIGLDISERTARRIIEGEITPPDNLISVMQAHSFAHASQSAPTQRKKPPSKGVSIHISEEDKQSISRAAKQAFTSIAPAYYLNDAVDTSARVANNTLIIEIPLIENSEE